jgi:hypothetical protein
MAGIQALTPQCKPIIVQYQVFVKKKLIRYLPSHYLRRIIRALKRTKKPASS